MVFSMKTIFDIGDDYAKEPFNIGDIVEMNTYCRNADIHGEIIETIEVNGRKMYRIRFKMGYTGVFTENEIRKHIK